MNLFEHAIPCIFPIACPQCETTFAGNAAALAARTGITFKAASRILSDRCVSLVDEGFSTSKKEVLAEALRTLTEDFRKADGK